MSEHFNLGPEPRIRITRCDGNLYLRGSDRDDIRISEPPLEQLSYQIEGTSLVIDRISGNGQIYVPASASLTIEHVSGNLEVKYLDRDVTVHDVFGNCTIRRVGAVLHTGNIKGSLQVKDVDSAVAIGEVSGSATVRRAASLSVSGTIMGGLFIREVGGEVLAIDVKGSLTAREVGSITLNNVSNEASFRSIAGSILANTIAGDLILRDINGEVTIEAVNGSATGRNIFHGVQINRVGGDLVLRTMFNPETTSRVEQVGGDVIIHLSDQGNILFVMPSNTEVRVSGDLAVDENEEGQLIVQAGDPQATFYVSAGGGVFIKTRYSESFDEEFTARFDIEFDTHWDNIARHLEESLEHKMTDLPEQIRQKVELKLNAAKHHLEVAQRKAEQAALRAERIDIGDFAFTIPKRQEPVGEEERLKILEMLENGIITVEQAEQLLSALEE